MLADDHELTTVRPPVGLGDGFDVVGEADDAEGAIDVINARVPDLVICDLHMPRGGGVAVVQKCALLCPIVILTVSEAESDLLDAVAAGAAGYLLKTTPIDELRASFKAAAAGEPVFSPSLAALVLGEFRRLAKAADTNPLTERSARYCNSLLVAARTRRSASSSASRRRRPRTTFVTSSANSI